MGSSDRVFVCVCLYNNRMIMQRDWRRWKKTGKIYVGFLLFIVMYHYQNRTSTHQPARSVSHFVRIVPIRLRVYVIFKWCCLFGIAFAVVVMTEYTKSYSYGYINAYATYEIDVVLSSHIAVCDSSFLERGSSTFLNLFSTPTPTQRTTIVIFE